VVITLLLGGALFYYLTDTSKVNPITRTYCAQLKDSLRLRGYTTDFYIVSAKRPAWFNNILVKLKTGAKSYSQHLHGNAIDIVVMDINNDGSSNAADVDIVYNILDKEIVRDSGGVGSYKNMGSFFSRQMVHFDYRGKKARWNK
jgi:uncharacterized protein YcbK (DUF882 family)